MRIIIQGDPIAQKRAKFRRLGNFVQTYDPSSKDKASFRKQIASFNIKKMFDSPKIGFLFYFPIPKAIRKKDLVLYRSERLRYSKKPDEDNLIKFYMDAMDGLVYEGDQKVSLAFSLRIYSEHPRTEIFIQESNPLIEQEELDLILLPFAGCETHSSCAEACHTDQQSPLPLNVV